MPIYTSSTRVEEREIEPIEITRGRPKLDD